PAVPYHNWEEYRERIEYLEKQPETYFEAIKAAKKKHKHTIGVFYRTNKPVYHKELYGDHNPITKRLSREERIDKIKKILVSK
ncbi:MAG: hypothetical protein ACFFEY_19330, partial [Candidatus Thorarchaeota archaeon]